MILTKENIKNLYRTRARNYDLSANFYYLIGFRETKYRKLAISKLGVQPGDTVVEIGCGTGINFKYVEDCVGSAGRIIGVDLTDAMLAKARERVLRNEWKNVELVQIDAAKFDYPTNTNAVFSTFALNLIPEYEEIIRQVSSSLPIGGRLVVLDLKKPKRWPLWLVKIQILATKPFGVSMEYVDKSPWEVMEKYFQKVTVKEIYGGCAFIAVGEKCNV